MRPKGEISRACLIERSMAIRYVQTGGKRPAERMEQFIGHVKNQWA